MLKSREISLADPSLKNCIDKGLYLKPIKEQGVIVSYFYINPKTLKEGDSWAYLRQESKLKGK